MKSVSSLWHKLSPEEKAIYRKGQPPSSSHQNGENQTKIMEDSNNDTQPADGGTRKLASFKKASDNVQNFMDDWFRWVCICTFLELPLVFVVD